MLNIDISPHAFDKLDSIYFYCTVNFGKTVARKINDKYNKTFQLLRQFLDMGKTENAIIRKGITYHSIVVYRHSKVIYYYDEKTMHIFDIWSTKQSTELLLKKNFITDKTNKYNGIIRN